MNKSINSKVYKVINLKTGVSGICRFDRIGALAVAHRLNQMNSEGRYVICAV